MKTLLLSLGAMLCIACNAQTNAPASTNSTPVAIVRSWFDLNDTNSLVNAKELSVVPLAKWDADENTLGGGAKLVWYVTDQQGLALTYSEFRHDSTWQVAHVMRTVFGALEVGLETGTLQKHSDGFGDVELYTAPTLTYQIKKTKKTDFRIVVGADILPGSTNPWGGLVFRFAR